MKKNIIASHAIFCLAIFAVLPSFAQDHKNDNEPARKKPAQNVTMGIEAGFNFANMDVQYDGNVNTYSFKTGIRFGFVIDAPLASHLYLQPGLFYAGNGTIVTYNDGTYSGSSNATINTLELPVNLLYKLGDPGGNRFFFGAGPYIGYNVSAKSVDVTTDLSTGVGQTTTSTFKIGSQNGVDDFKAIDFGLGLNVGYQLASGLFFRFRFQRGLSNMSPNDGTTIHTTSIGLQVGYLFPAKGAAHSSSAKKERARKEHSRNAVQAD